MASVIPSPTPNPNAMKFSLDIRLPESFSFADAQAAAGHPFSHAVFAAPGVAAVFGTADFVTVTRKPGVEWDPIVSAVEMAAAEHL